METRSFAARLRMSASAFCAYSEPKRFTEGPHSSMRRTWAGSSLARNPAMGCSTPLSKTWKSDFWRPSTNLPRRSVAMTPTLARLTSTRIAGVCGSCAKRKEGRTRSKKKEACRRKRRQAFFVKYIRESSVGDRLSNLRAPNSWLRLGWRSCWRCSSRRSGSVLGRRKVAGDLVLANGEDDDFIRHAARASDVKLHGFAGSLVFLFDLPIVRDERHSVLGFFGIGLVEIDLDGADALRVLGPLDAEFVVVAIAAALEVFEVVVIARDEAAHDAHVTLGAFELGLGGFEIAACIGDVFFGAAHFRCNRADLFIAFGLHGGDLAGELLVGGDLFLADGFGAALGLRDFGSGHADFLLRDFDDALEFSEASIGLIELRAERGVGLLRVGEVLGELGRGTVREKADGAERYEKQNE